MADETFDWLNPFASIDLGIASWADGIKQWAISNREMIQPVKRFFETVIVGIETALHAVPPVVMLVALVLVLLVGTPSQRLRRLNQVRDAMNEIGAGDGGLSRRIDARGEDELPDGPEDDGPGPHGRARRVRTGPDRRQLQRICRQALGHAGAAPGRQQAVAQIDQMTEQNAALVEEGAAAAQTLKDQSVRLSEVVTTFRLFTTDAAYSALRLSPRVGRMTHCTGFEGPSTQAAASVSQPP